MSKSRLKRLGTLKGMSDFMNQKLAYGPISTVKEKGSPLSKEEVAAIKRGVEKMKQERCKCKLGADRHDVTCPLAIINRGVTKIGEDFGDTSSTSSQPVKWYVGPTQETKLASPLICQICLHAFIILEEYNNHIDACKVKSKHF